MKPCPTWQSQSVEERGWAAQVPALSFAAQVALAAGSPAAVTCCAGGQEPHRGVPGRLLSLQLPTAAEQREGIQEPRLGPARRNPPGEA